MDWFNIKLDFPDIVYAFFFRVHRQVFVFLVKFVNYILAAPKINKSLALNNMDHPIRY